MTEYAAILRRLRAALVEEATPLPGQQLAYGRPHEHPRARHYPRYSPTGERLSGVNIVRPDCPRPVKGRCECAPDGSWRPAVGVLRADSTVHHAVSVPAERLRPGFTGSIWVAEVYEQEPDGRWHCRWPVRRALERLRQASPARFTIAVRLLRGDHPRIAWGAQRPPDPFTASARLLAEVEHWADIEADTDWERRPRQWWDPPRKPKVQRVRPVPKSDAQLNAEHLSQRIA